MFIELRRLSIFAERVPFAWSEPVGLSKRRECGNRYSTWDVICGGLRVVACWRRR